MKNKIIDLIYAYSIKGRLVDQDYIKELINIIVTCKNLDNYFGLLKIHSQKKLKSAKEVDLYTLASYDWNSQNLNIYSQNINWLLKSESKYLYLFNNYERLFFDNLLITQVILHELEHIDQKRKMSEEKNFESEFLRFTTSHDEYNIEFLLKKGYTSKEAFAIFTQQQKNNSDYEKNYNISPEERLAELNSHYLIIDLLSHTPQKLPHLISFYQTRFLQILIKNYTYDFYNDIIISPTNLYLEKTDNLIFSHHFPWYDINYFNCLANLKNILSLDERLKFGLSIDTEELYRYQKKLFNKSKIKYLK